MTDVKTDVKTAVKVDSACRMFKYLYSSLLLIFSIVLIIGNMFNRQTRLSFESSPVLALVIMLLAIIWLTMVEGGQGALVGLGPVDAELYRESHPMTYRGMKLVYKGDNLDRYLLGRQFMVILIVFIVELCGATHGSDGHSVELWGMPNWIINIFLVSGVSMILFTCMVGQLNSEIISCHYMLDYRKSNSQSHCRCTHRTCRILALYSLYEPEDWIRRSTSYTCHVC